MKAVTLLAIGLLSLTGFAQSEGITVNGTVERDVAPDELHLQFYLTTEAKEVKEAFDGNEEKSAAVIAYLKDLEEICEVSTAHTSIRENTIYRDGERIRTGFLAAQSFNVIIRDFDEYPVIVGKLIDMGVENLSSGRFSYSKANELRAEMRTQCIAQARAKAEEVAEALGVQLGMALSYDEPSAFSGVMPYANVEMMDGVQVRGARSDGPSVVPGKQTISMSVTVRFAILAPQE